MDASALLVLHTFKIATMSYTVISTYKGKFDSSSHAVIQHIYVRKTPQLSFSMMMDLFVLLVLHTFNIATVSYCKLVLSPYDEFIRVHVARCAYDAHLRYPSRCCHSGGCARA